MIKWDTLTTAEDKLEDYKQSKRQWLNQERDRLIYNGLHYDGNHYQTRPEDITNIMGAVQVAQLAAAAGQEFQTQWLTSDNQEIPMGLSELAGLGVALAEHKKRLVYKCREHKEALDHLPTKDAVDEYLLQLDWGQ